MKVLILEDNEQRNERFRTVCKAAGIEFIMTETAEDCIKALAVANNGLDFDMIFLDHDLGGQAFVDQSYHNTGSEVVRWLVQWGPDTVIIIHSMNAPAAMSMERQLLDAHFGLVYRIPWIQLTGQLCEIIEERKGWN